MSTGRVMSAARIERAEPLAGSDGGARTTVDVSRQSLSKTSGLDGLGEVNVETSIQLCDEFGGHLPSGHACGIGIGIGIVQHMAPAAESWEWAVLAPRKLGEFLACKGSVAVNDVSLTVNRVIDAVDAAGVVGGRGFSMPIIPHTDQVTTLRQLRAGSCVNVESVLIARHVERMPAAQRA